MQQFISLIISYKKDRVTSLSPQKVYRREFSTVRGGGGGNISQQLRTRLYFKRGKTASTQT